MKIFKFYDYMMLYYISFLNWKDFKVVWDILGYNLVLSMFCEIGF